MGHAPGSAAALVLAALRLYQRWMGPLLRPRCRFWPSCSEYARLAITRHGVVIGGASTLSRVLRCQPLFPGGIDPPR